MSSTLFKTTASITAFWWPKGEESSIAAANLILTVLLGIGTILIAFLSYRLSKQQSEFASNTKLKEKLLEKSQEDINRRQVLLQEKQVELERLSSLHASLDASRAITDRLLQLNEVQMSHSKISLMEIQESENFISEVRGSENDIMALRTLIYMKLNIFEGIVTLISGEEKELLKSVEKGGFDSNGWGNWVKSELKKPLISSVFNESPAIWSARLKQLHARTIQPNES